MGVLKVHDGSSFVEVPIVADHGGLTGLGDNDHPQYALDATAVVAAAVIADNAIVAGDGGARGVQGRLASIADTGVMSVPGLGTGGVTDYDLRVGNVTTPNYGMIQIGDACFGRTSFNVGAIDLNGTILCQNKGGPVTGDIEFIWTESTGGTARFVLPKSGVGLATYNSRSMLLAGPAPADTDFVKVTYWQGQGIFDNLACDTSGTGADLGVQNDLEVEGTIYCDTLIESTIAAGVTIDGLLLKDGQVELVDNKKVILGTGGDAEIYYNGTHLVLDPDVVGTGGVYIQGHIGLGTVPSTSYLFGISGSSADVTRAFFVSQIYTGSAPSLIGMDFVAGYQGTSAALMSVSCGTFQGKLNAVVAISQTGIATGGDFLGSVITEQSNTGTTLNVYGITGEAKATLSGKDAHTDGDFNLIGIYGKAPGAPTGTPNSSNEWAGLFDGDVQISSNKKLILEGSPTSKGDTYLVWNTSNSHIEFWINGTLEGYVDTSGFVSV